MKPYIWVVKTPRGKLLAWTADYHRQNVQSSLWEIGCGDSSTFSGRYWKDWTGAQREMRRRGWSIVKVSLVETKK